MAGLHAFVDQYAGSAVTHLFLCPNAMRASFRSRSRDAIWATVGGKEPDGRWPQNAKRLFEAGLDPYQVWSDRCREKGISPWLSMRMNDVHGVDDTSNFQLYLGAIPKRAKACAIVGLAKRDGVANARLMASLNNRELGRAQNAADLHGFGGGTVRAVRFPCPIDAVKDGHNTLHVRQIGSGAPQQIVWVEIRLEP